jgi:hypothetical protein
VQECRRWKYYTHRTYNVFEQVGVLDLQLRELVIL